MTAERFDRSATVRFTEGSAAEQRTELLTPRPGNDGGPSVSVIYYSATGSVHAMARAVATGAAAAGGDVRLRRVAENAPAEAISANEAWSAHLRATAGIPLATPDDVDWADVVLFGTPTRFGNVAAQLKSFLDALGPLWGAGRLAGKVFAGFVSTATAHGGQESTLLALYQSVYHFGGIVVAPGYTDPVQFEAGNPYGASHTSDNGAVPPGELELTAARFTGWRATAVGRELRAGRKALGPQR
ncbi:MAG TPA: NAD(P)H:quinone oxidoreductase [Mycobacteriales bacterium]|jgi:NAD(P)H dehydrogenase (quinone)|nr:NAD(P)H:quinone oxidoreductase [Mycobacteriales bacterium]